MISLSLYSSRVIRKKKNEKLANANDMYCTGVEVASFLSNLIDPTPYDQSTYIYTYILLLNECLSSPF